MTVQFFCGFRALAYTIKFGLHLIVIDHIQSCEFFCESQRMEVGDFYWTI